VIPVVVGSSPIVHPIYIKNLSDIDSFYLGDCVQIRDAH
jgi:hypothetical protein